MVQLEINDTELELTNDTKIKYTMQIADVLNLSVVTSNYTNSFSIPKTPNNTRAFQQLGIIGDTSNIPYDKIPATLSDNGFPVITSGWLSVRETNEFYQVSIIDGIIDFFKAIENKTIGTDLDLSNFEHEKTMANVVGSFTDGEYYRYIVADYNGKNIGQVAETTGINIDYLIPCFRVRKIWELIFSTFDYACDYTNISDFLDGLFITYPKPPQEDEEPELIATANKTNWNSSAFGNWQGMKYVPSQEFWSSTAGIGWSGWTNVIQETGSFTFTVNIEAYARYYNSFGLDSAQPAIINILVNGNVIASMQTDPFAEVILSINYAATQGDVVQVRLSAAASNNSLINLQIRHLNSSLSIYSINLGEVSLIESFKDLSIKDFFKEIIWRTALIPILNTQERTMSFLPLSERINFANAVDWSEKYIMRTGETYTQDGYTQKNIFKLKHNNEVDTRGDGYLYVNNRNLPDESTIVASKLYAPETFNTEFTPYDSAPSRITDTYKVWEREAKTGEAGEIEIDYKGLSNRLYFMREVVDVNDWMFVSEYLTEIELTANVPFAINNETLFDELVFKNYAGYDGVLNNFRMHQIELALNAVDILQLDLTKPHYIETEGMYYLVNKVTWENGKTSMAECIRINAI